MKYLIFSSRLAVYRFPKYRPGNAAVSSLRERYFQKCCWWKRPRAHSSNAEAAPSSSFYSVRSIELIPVICIFKTSKTDFRYKHLPFKNQFQNKKTTSLHYQGGEESEDDKLFTHLSLMLLSHKGCEGPSLSTPPRPTTEVAPQPVARSCFPIWGPGSTSSKSFT